MRVFEKNAFAAPAELAREGCAPRTPLSVPRSPPWRENGSPVPSTCQLVGIKSARNADYARAAPTLVSAWFADDQRNVALGAVLVSVVTLVGRYNAGPQLGLLLR